MKNEVMLIMAWDEAVRAARERGLSLSWDEDKCEFELRRGVNLLGVGTRVVDMMRMVREQPAPGRSMYVNHVGSR